MEDTLSQWIYLAGPLFTQAETEFNSKLTRSLTAVGYRVYLPQQECAGITAPADIYQTCLRGIDGAGALVAILDGADADSGTCFEMGYALAQKIPIIGVRTDFRGTGDHQGLNLMLTNSCDRLIIASLDPPISYPPSFTYLSVGGDVVPPILAALSAIFPQSS